MKFQLHKNIKMCATKVLPSFFFPMEMLEKNTRGSGKVALVPVFFV